MASWTAARITKVFEGAGKVLEVLGEAAISPEPGESALDQPPTGRPTMPFMSSLRLTISMRSTGTPAR
jgi:hypothetical protein